MNTPAETLRVIFMGTPDFSVPALKEIHENTPHEVVAVYTQPPRPKGRGHRVQKSPVHQYADSQDIDVFTPVSLKGEADQNVFAQQNADVAIVAAYGLILPKIVLDAPRYGCINIHASLLPRWRGASPIQQAIWHGDAQSGVAIMQMDVGLDTGPVIIDGRVPITSETTSQTLHDQLSDMGGHLIVETLHMLSALPADQARLSSTMQDEALVTYAPLLNKNDGQINWAQTAAQIDQQIRALNPWPGVFTTCGETKFKITAAHVSSQNNEGKSCGAVLSRDGDIACGEDTVLRIDKIQPHGKKPMDFISAVNGGYVKIGDTFNA